MTRRDTGWFDGPELPSGTDYRFALDNGDPLPDPRSRWQPEGPHGPSRSLDHDEYAWSDDGWRGAPLAGAVIYECHIGTFTDEGTFDSAIERLPHLVDVGVTALELMPVAEFSGRRGWGYDGVDLFAPHHAYGGPDGLKRLVDAAHGHGLAVIVDVVYNHLGPDGNYLSQYGPYFTDRYATPWGDAINFDGPGSDEVRRFFIDNALMWLRDYHFDGLRLDAIHAILDSSALHLLEQMKVEVEELEAQLGRTLWVIAESDLNDPRIVQRREAGGYGLDAQWSDDFHHSVHSVLTGETQGYYADFGSLEHLAKALTNAFVYNGIHSNFRQRVHGRAPVGVPGHRFLGYIQNHDQIGNRAKGDRLGSLVGPDLQKVGAALVMTSPFVPKLFQGEEWGATTPFLYFTDHNEELGRLVSQGRKQEFAAFGWNEHEIPDPQHLDTFEASRLRWDEMDDPRHADLLEWHKRLIRLRRDNRDLSDGRMDLVETAFDEHERWLVVRRGAITIACNVGPDEVSIPLEASRTAELLLTSGKAPEGDRLAPESVSIWRAG
ncbi:MAG: maltooligosyltrehalose trehalohydrolase [Actinomycetota bacterium]|nr:maltooligosyltrehalose trehalohydrolase [Actinomycetota bacterium]